MRPKWIIFASGLVVSALVATGLATQPASAAPAVPVHSPQYTSRQLIEGLVFRVGAVSLRVYGSESSVLPNAADTQATNQILTSLGPGAQHTLPLLLQSGAPLSAAAGLRLLGTAIQSGSAVDNGSTVLGQVVRYATAKLIQDGIGGTKPAGAVSAASSNGSVNVNINVTQNVTQFVNVNAVVFLTDIAGVAVVVLFAFFTPFHAAGSLQYEQYVATLTSDLAR